MLEKDHLHLSGICQRIFNFLTGFLFPSEKRVTDDAVPVLHPSVNGVGSVEQHQQPRSFSKPKAGLSRSEIEIHFKQTEEDWEPWTPIDKLGSSVHFEQDYQPQFKKGDNVSSSSSAIPYDTVIGKRRKVTESPRKKELQLPIVDVNGSSQHQGTKTPDQPPPRQQQNGQTEPNLTSMAQGRRPQNVFSRNSSTQNRARDTSTIPQEIQKQAIRPHLIDVAPNINEKTDAFLKIKKKDMRRNLGLEPEES